MIKLYQYESCPYCARVRAKMSELEMTYISINVPRDKGRRNDVVQISGQAGVPTLVTEDGHVIADDDDAIVAFLEQNYGLKPRLHTPSQPSA